MPGHETNDALRELDELRLRLASLRDEGPTARIGEIRQDIRRLAADLHRLGVDLKTPIDRTAES